MTQQHEPSPASAHPNARNDVPEPSSCEDAPLVGLRDLDELWFQVGGTLCNLSCNHCFISCHPGNDSFGFLTYAAVERHLDSARARGVKEFYFTGGEPFLNRDLLRILEATLQIGPATVLTNGTVLTERILAELARLRDGSRFSLELRVSIDGYNAKMNDPIRGEGTFEAAMSGVEKLVGAGFLPIITVAQTWPDGETPTVLREFTQTLKSRGYTRPRIKLLPTIHLGMEESRSRGYLDDERVNAGMLEDFDLDQLLCHHSRTVTDRGVAACPILIEAPGAHFGAQLEDAMAPVALTHNACFTCYLYGTICSNTGSSSGADR